jgi:hypothetical protein
MFQGSELSVETTGSGLCTHFKCIRLQLVLPGNWEVIWGRRDANTVRLTKCKNMYKYVPRFRWWKTWRTYFPTLWYGILQEQNWLLGYTDPLVPIRQSPNYSKGIYTPPEDNLAHYIDVLRNQEQCSYIIIIAHLGLSQQIVGKQTRMWGVNYILRWYA